MDLKNYLQQFLAERCYAVPGAKTKACEVLALFRAWCGEHLVELRGPDAKRETILAELQAMGYPLGYTNPYTEVAHRFRDLNPHAMVKVRAMLNDGERQYAAGRP
jgi:hypothetical protein